MENSNDNRELMRATPEWMKENYDRFNQELFGGALGDCKFEIFTTGRGSQGGVLGWFCVTGPGIKVERSSRQMFKYVGYDKLYVDRDNFVELCQPCIKLNGNYTGTEHSLQDTLVHEMCHYGDYMSGSCPKQGHGPRFRNIAAMISERSNGRFTVQRLASAEVMKGYKLDDEMQKKKDERIARKKARAMAIIVYRKNGGIELTLVSNTDSQIPRRIYEYYSMLNNNSNEKAKDKGAKEIITSTDPALIEMLYSNGYRKLMRTWRYWNVENEPFADSIKDYDFDWLMKPEMYENMKRKTINQIVESVIDEYVNDMNSDDINITGINLGVCSPLEDREN